jgi:tetratricopeptide (TPR) repeat protein
MPTHRQKLAQALDLQQAGQLKDAERVCREILADHPDDFDTLRQLAHVLGLRGSLEAAEATLRHALRLRPDAAEAAGHLRSLLAAKEFRQGVAWAKEQKTDEAVASMRRAIAHEPGFAQAHQALGTLLAGQGKLDEAVVSFRAVVALSPNTALAHYNLALALQNQQQYAEAEAGYRRALQLDPKYAHAHNNLAIVLAEQGRPAEAEASYRKAVECAPDYADAHFNLADLLVKQNRLDEAEDFCRRGLKRSTDPVDAHYKLGIALAAQNKLGEAAACYRKVIELESDHADAHVGLATMLLLSGNFAAGWPEYEWRLKHPDMPKTALSQPRWQGEPLEGRTILLGAEQGAGDTIQFVRYADVVKQRGGTVVAECAANLERLLATCTGVDSVVAAGRPRPHFDVYAPLPSLPGILGASLETIPAQVPYLFPDEAAVAPWRDELKAETALNIGIAWQGNPRQKRDEYRSIPLAKFAPIARAPGVRLYSLQFGTGREQIAAVARDLPLQDLGDRLGDFHHTAALMRHLDLVITCDSAPAHLAGALGLPVWLALTYSPDWRWLLDRADSPWYPTMRLFRQPRPGDWEGTFREIEEALAALVESRSGGR